MYIHNNVYNRPQAAFTLRDIYKEWISSTRRSDEYPSLISLEYAVCVLFPNSMISVRRILYRMVILLSTKKYLWKMSFKIDLQTPMYRRKIIKMFR